MGYFDDDLEDEELDDLFGDTDDSGDDDSGFNFEPEQKETENQSLATVDFDNYDQEDDEDAQADNRAVAKFAIIAGIVVLIVALGFISITRAIKNGGGNKKQQVNNQPVAEYDVVEQVQETVPVPLDKWQELTEYNDVQFTTSKKATMTVTAIKAYAAQDGDTIAVKAILEGNITGLVGTFEVNIDYSKVNNYTVGQTLGVVYQEGTLGESKIIGKISVN